jgi:hypothetical protein
VPETESRGAITRGGESASEAPPCSARKKKPFGPEAKQHFVARVRRPREIGIERGEENMFIQKVMVFYTVIRFAIFCH